MVKSGLGEAGVDLQSTCQVSCFWCRWDVICLLWGNWTYQHGDSFVMPYLYMCCRQKSQDNSGAWRAVQSIIFRLRIQTITKTVISNKNDCISNKFAISYFVTMNGSVTSVTSQGNEPYQKLTLHHCCGHIWPNLITFWVLLEAYRGWSVHV